MPAQPIVVVNPNSNPEVTADLERGVAPLRFSGGPTIVCETLEGAPFAIETQTDVEAVTRPLAQRIAKGDAAAWIIACYSDPGLAVCRELAEVPVFGIGESGVLAALQRGDHVGVVALSRRAIPRHRRQQRMLGVERRIAGERALELTVAELVDETATWRRLKDVGHKLREEDGADVVVLGCAGMARYRRRLARELGLAVIDPAQAAVVTALGAVALAEAEV
ncbi:MAG: Asp/Glu racemase [Alphaproteobacteria bacterium]|jgi:Asp/Glu/hydantoin racemase|nr:Asp/Glu racemase [Alphaproteobacteria bacterium]